MKKFALLFALIGIVNYSYTNSGGSPGGKSGSPASNGQTCAGGYCHGGGSATGNELVDIQVDVTPYAGSSNYSVPICVPLASSMLAENPIFELPAAATLRYT